MSSRKCKGCGEFFSVKLDTCPACSAPYTKAIAAARAALPALMENAPRVAPGHPCIAYGCPLYGTWNPIIYGDKHPWYCFIHGELPASDWQRATAAINRVRDELRPIPDDKEYRRQMRKYVNAALAPRLPGSDDA